MPIYAPGKRDKHNRLNKSKGRSIVAMLSLTAMVDMFTVLVVFLLQNYQVTGEVIEIEDSVELPKATETKEIEPAHVVVVSKNSIMLDKEVLASFNDVREQQDWMINPLFNRLQLAFKEAEAQRQAGLNSIKSAIDASKEPSADPSQQPSPDADRFITVQADKNIDFLTIKKVMTTIIEAGASQVNFAVIKNEKGAAP